MRICIYTTKQFSEPKIKTLRGFQNEMISVAKECKALNKNYKIIAVIFFIVNFFLIWVYTTISEFVVSLERLSELNGYMLTEEQEVMFFWAISIPMFLVQFIYLFFILIYFKKRQFKKYAIIYNVVGYSLLFLWFVFSVYRFTINGY